MGRGTKHQIILRIKEDFRRLDSKLPFSFSGQGPGGRGWDLKIDTALFETWIFTCRTTALWNRVFPLCPRSRHVPSNLIFKSETCLCSSLTTADSYPCGPQPWSVADEKCSVEPSPDAKGPRGNQPASLPASPAPALPLGPWGAGQ